MVLAVCTLALLVHPAEAGPSSGVTSIAVFPLRSASDDPSLQWMSIALQDAMTIDLWYLSAFHAPSLVGFIDTAALTPAALSRLDRPFAIVRAQKIGVQRLITGSYRTVGDDLEATVEVIDLSSGQGLATATARGSKDHLTDLASRLVVTLAKRLALGRGRRSWDALEGRSRLGRSRPSAKTPSATSTSPFERSTRTRRREPLLSRPWAKPSTRHPQYAEAWNNLGWNQYGSGAKKEALESFRRALVLRPGLIDAQSGVTECLSDEGKHQEAIEAATALTRLNPSLAFVVWQLGSALERAGRGTEALGVYERAMQAFEQALGKEHPDVAGKLGYLADLHENLGQHAEAEALYTRSLAIKEKKLGPEHRSVATILNNLAGVYQSTGQYAKAEPLYRRSLAIEEKKLGPEHLEAAPSLNNLAGLYYRMGQYAKAEPLYLRALAIYEKALGPEHPGVATSLNNLAVLYRDARRVRQGRAALHAARSPSARRRSGRRIPMSPTSLNNLAVLYQAHGRLREGRAALPAARSRSARRRSAPSIPTCATSLNNLAALYQARARTAKAEPLYQRALAIREKALGPDHPDVATSLNNLAALYQRRATTRRPSRSISRALAIREKALGPTHPDVATSLNNLAALYQAQGSYAKAEPLYQPGAGHPREGARGRRIPTSRPASTTSPCSTRRKARTRRPSRSTSGRSTSARRRSGPMHPDVATSLNNLAVLYQAQGAVREGRAAVSSGRSTSARRRWARCIPMWRPASTTSPRSTRRKARTRRPSRCASARSTSARRRSGRCIPTWRQASTTSPSSTRRQGAYAKAEPLYLRALDIREKALGAEHLGVATSLNNLAVLYKNMGHYTKAEPLFIRATPWKRRSSGPSTPTSPPASTTWPSSTRR